MAQDAPRSVIDRELLSQTASAIRMGPKRFGEIMPMVQKESVQTTFNSLFPNIANDPKSQKHYLDMQESVFEGDIIDCYKLLREAYGKPKPVKVFDAKTETSPCQAKTVSPEHPLEADPSTFIS